MFNFSGRTVQLWSEYSREPYCIKFDKAELEEIQGGQAYKINLDISDPTKEYQLYNANGEKANAVSVGELLGYYNKKGHFESQANDKTQKASHNKGEGAFRIELFDRNKNEIKLIGLPIKADELQNILKDKGLSEKDINNTVNRIYDRMPDYFRERFEYTPAKVELNIKKDVDIKTIKKTAELGEFLRSAEKINIGNDVRDKTKVIIVDKEHNKFMEASAKISRSSVSEFAKLFTKNEAAQAILSHKFSKSYDKIGLKENAEQVRSQEVQVTDGNSVPIPAGSELPKEPMIVEAVLDDNKAFTIAVTDEDFAISSTVGDNIVYHTGNKDMDMETYSEMLMQDYGLTGKQTEQLLSKLDELNCGIFPETVISEKMSVKRFTKDSIQINVDGNKEIFRRKELNPDNISRRFELKKIYLNENAKDCKAVSKAAKSMLAENILKTFTFDKTFKSAKNMADRLNKGITGKSKEKIISNDERSR